MRARRASVGALGLTLALAAAGASQETVSPVPSPRGGAAPRDTLVVPLHVGVPADTLALGAPFTAHAWFVPPRAPARVDVPVPPGALEPLELIAWRREPDRGDTIRLALDLRVFQVGAVRTPPIVALAALTDGALCVAAGDTLAMTVASIVPVDASGIRDIKDALPIENRRAWWPFALAALAVALAALGWWRRRRTHRGPEGLLLQRPAHEIALEGIAALARSDRAREGPWKPFYTELATVLRAYLARRYGFDALDMTTTETLRALRAHEVTSPAASALSRVLLAADSVKFAKGQPESEQPAGHLEDAERFVRETRFREPVVPRALAGC